METRKYTITKTREIHDCKSCDYHSCYVDKDTISLGCSCHHPSLHTSKAVETGLGFPEWCPLPRETTD